MPSYRFERFVLRAETGELFRDGARVGLQPQPLQVLTMLLERPGELVSRNELKAAIWGEETFGDVDHGLNIAIKKLRDGLGDSAEQPRFVETIPRKGYRFLGTVTVEGISRSDVAGAAMVDPSTRRWRIPAAIVAVLVLSVAAVSLVSVRNAGEQGRERPMVLVGQFSNESGEKDLDGILETALEAELTASRVVAIAPAKRVEDALLLMRQPVAARVPLPLAREICLRDPGIHAALAGSIRKVGSEYVLAAEMLRAEDSGPAIVLTQTAAGKEGILPAVRKLADSVRAGLGEEPASIQETRNSVERVTTRSIVAWRLYSEATALGRDRKWAAAEVLLRQAVETDPEFASAHLLLAWAIRNQRVDVRVVGSEAKYRPEYLPFAQRALDLASTTSDRESYFIRASYHSLSGDLEGAIPFYEALLKRYPDHMWAADNLLVAYSRMNQFARLYSLKLELVTLRPNDPGSHLGAASACFCLTSHDLQKIPGLLDHAVELARESNSPDRELIEFTRVTRNAMLAWVQRDVSRCKALLGEAEKMPQPRGGSGSIPEGYLALGMLQHAEEMIQRVSHVPARTMLSAWRALFAGDEAAVVKVAGELQPVAPIDQTLLALLHANQTEAVARLIGQIPGAGYLAGPGVRRLLDGELAFRQGRLDVAIERLSPEVEASGATYLAPARVAAQTLAEALVMKGQRERAVAVLEKASLHPGCGYFENAMHWPHIRFQLMQLYREQGRFAEAAAIHTELREYMRFADSTSVLRAKLDVEPLKSTH